MERLIVWHRWSPPPESSPEAVARGALWRTHAREHLARETGEVLCELGGTGVFSLEPGAATRAVEVCLELVGEFQADAEESGGVSFALTLGPIERGQAPDSAVGDALDRAQLLANHVIPGEIVLDPGVQALVSASFLFAREVHAAPFVRGEVVDRVYPRRAECSRALAHLARPHLSGAAQAQFNAFRQLAAAAGRQRVVLTGPYGSGGAAWTERVADELGVAVWLDVRAAAEALAPLSGLTRALARLPADRMPERVLTAGDEPDRQSLATLRSVREGRAVARRDAILALRQYLGRAHELTGKRVLVSLNPAPLIDPGTVGVIAEATREGSPDGLLVVRLPLDAKAPDAFVRGGPLAEIRMPSLSQQEARSFALSMLGKDTTTDIARRAAAMGGNTPLGVAEAVRVLIASGDVVFDAGKYRWRRGPAGRVSTLTVEALLEERIDQLDAATRRVLQILALAPDPEQADLIAEVAAADGVAADVCVRATARLLELSLIERPGQGLGVSPLVRDVVEAGLAPDRRSELSAFLAGSLARRVPSEDAFARASIAHYLARCERIHEAVEVLLDVAVTAGHFGFVRSAVRLAAAAVECDPTDATRARAASIAERLNERVTATRRPRAALPTPAALAPDAPGEPPASHSEASPAPLAAQAMQGAVEAILARDFDAVDRSLELVVAAGKDGPSVDRLRAMTYLVKGDRESAMRLLERARHREQDAGGETPRTALALALILVETGELALAVREGLRALARARAAGDGAGERAARLVLGACYRRLGRPHEAVAIEDGRSRSALRPATLGGSSGE